MTAVYSAWISKHENVVPYLWFEVDEAPERIYGQACEGGIHTCDFDGDYVNSVSEN